MKVDLTHEQALTLVRIVEKQFDLEYRKLETDIAIMWQKADFLMSTPDTTEAEKDNIRPLWNALWKAHEVIETALIYREAENGNF